MEGSSVAHCGGGIESESRRLLAGRASDCIWDCLDDTSEGGFCGFVGCGRALLDATLVI